MQIRLTSQACLVTIRNNTTLKQCARYKLERKKFGYHQKQHNSQTLECVGNSPQEFGYHQKQHNSQTNAAISIR